VVSPKVLSLGVALNRLMELFFRYLTEHAGLTPPEAASVLWRDDRRGGRDDKPKFLRDYLPEDTARARVAKSSPRSKRQARHGATPQMQSS
jgi:hypothetical protein